MKAPTETEALIQALRDEADLCRNETANDVAELLMDAAAELALFREWIAIHLQQSDTFHGGTPFAWEELGAESKAKWLSLADNNVRPANPRSSGPICG
jgi:hypothetical protein